jgi:23S rRNA (cytosine1962-C5)-methyltransferase
VSDLSHRLQKNYRRLAAQFKSQNVEAWRLYAQDIPSYPYLIDLYKNYCVLYDQGKSEEVSEEIIEIHHNEARTALKELLKITDDEIIIKRRQRQKGHEQYEVLDPRADETMIVEEGKLRFEVNLRKYLDSGLFLDHRPLRREILKSSQNKKVLNLFCYTGSISVAAAVGGAQEVTSVDMSNTYLQWSRRNFLLNEIRFEDHKFIQADIVAWLKEPVEESWDIIILDPPSFSNSKRMEDVLDIERDHPDLIKKCMKRLSTNGVLYFSTNKRKFKLSETLPYFSKEITHWTTPLDFKETNIHKAWEFRHSKS